MGNIHDAPLTSPYKHLLRQVYRCRFHLLSINPMVCSVAGNRLLAFGMKVCWQSVGIPLWVQLSELNIYAGDWHLLIRNMAPFMIIQWNSDRIFNQTVDFVHLEMKRFKKIYIWRPQPKSFHAGRRAITKVYSPLSSWYNYIKDGDRTIEGFKKIFWPTREYFTVLLHKLFLTYIFNWPV